MLILDKGIKYAINESMPEEIKKFPVYYILIYLTSDSVIPLQLWCC